MAKEESKKKEEQKPKKKKVESADEVIRLDEKDRFRYIGFDVYGGSPKEYFKSEEELEKHRKAVQEYSKGHTSTFRSFTAVNQELLPLSNKIVLTISCLVLIVSAFLPWISFKSSWVSYSFAGLTGFFSASQYTDYLKLFNPNLMIFVYVPAALAFLAFIFGILTLIMLYLPYKSFEGYLSRLKRVMSLQWYVLGIWVAFFIFSIIGVSLPFGEWMSEHYGVRAVSDRVNVVTFTTLAGLGVWLSIGALTLNAVKSNDF